ncbi:hypothetical protein cyc_02114 [Cyclospora cayetanensis]|uniref:PROP1-like PPR domain-containing protein n=1 Tax=Cyclospora cayetanensis TaxID=88456 RepID=A0A1D3CWQ0_9EIME|nr:hypothetical protein cyc_02114 [Cyclospora cayetanensis]
MAIEALLFSSVCHRGRSTARATFRLSVLLLLLLFQAQRAEAAAALRCHARSRACCHCSSGGPTGFLHPAGSGALALCSGSSSRAAAVYEHRARHRHLTSHAAASTENAAQSILREQESQQQQQKQDGSAAAPPQIDLARAFQLLEAVSSGGPPLFASSQGGGTAGSEMPVPKAGMGEKQRLAVIFNCLLHACERQGDALGGFEVYRQMKATGAPPDEATFHSVAALLERSGEQHGMLKVGCKATIELLEHMQAEGHEPSLAVLSLAVTCCSRAGAADAALHLSQQLRRRIRTAAAAAAPTAAVGVAPWTAGLEKEDEGIRAAATALQQALPSSVYAALVSGCAAAGRHEKALHLYGELASLKGYQELLQRRLAQKAQNTQQEQQQQLEPETLQHLQQLLRRDSYLPKAQVVNAAVAAAAATGRLQLALSFYRRDLLRQQEQQVQHGEDHFAEDTLGSLSGGEAYAPTTETFLLLLTAAAAQQSSSTVDILLRDFEQQQLLRQQQQLPPLDAPAIHAAAAEALAAGGRSCAAAGAPREALGQPIPLELRLRIASLKLMGLLHTRQSLAAARQREHLLHLIEKSSSRGARPVQRGSGVPQSIEGLHQELQPVAINDALTEDVLKLAENMLGPPVQEHHLQRATPLLHPHERERLEEQQRQRHREMVLEQIRQHEQQPRTHNPHSE